MRASFAQLTVGGRGRLEFRIASVDPVTMVAVLDLLSGSDELGTATVDLANNTAEFAFTAPLVEAEVEVVAQVFADGDVIRRVDGVDFVCHGMDGDKVLTAVATAAGGATYPQPSGEFVRVGVATLGG